MADGFCTMFPMSKQVSPEMRAKYDEIFMQVMLGTQAEAQTTQPQAPGNLAAMFHKQQVADALQQCAVLIAAWNQGEIDTKAISKCAAALKGLGLSAAAERIENLVKIDEE
ncbi:hypothetical protein DC3_46520 [Deinococcus cellulosilyticus NBRC 106333 = KACC 11606]|uniref:Uncharacterized protein n=2 Tax=Deinococcus cellulosilyticus TaxID=401558 RepID=A0A511N905_DEIC1|nr:hypothetical protein DC3_46520 [Deinococcus cellulosilyticus NBRC 106333 = KACC 11606]